MKKIKYHLTVGIFLLLNTIIAQIIPERPNTTVPSPQASEFTKYGDVAVNESKGEISPSIPIYTYKVGKINVPIELNYRGSGVKVIDRPNSTGMNWVLNVGGVINRTVRDLPDETDRPRKLYSKEYFDNVLIPHEGLPIDVLSDFALHPQKVDSESDVFNFNFPGHSGSFVLKENPDDGTFEPKLLKYDKELKIELLGNFSEVGLNNYEFKITTPDGISYYFGGFVGEDGVNPDENGEYEIGRAVEESQYVHIEPRGGGARTYGARAKTAFYLTKIEDHLGNKVLFEYYTKDEYEVLTPISYSASRLVASSPEVDSRYTCTPSGISGDDYQSSCVQKNTIFSGKFLKKIWTPSNIRNKVVFVSEEKERVPSASSEILGGPINHFLIRILKEIRLPTQIVDFEYTPPKDYLIRNSNSPRDKFFLSEVTFKNRLTSEEKAYKMEYKSPLTLPDFFSKAKDFLEYYNGKTTNQETLLPRYARDFIFRGSNPQGMFFNYLDAFSTIGYDKLADRDTYFDFATIGTLEKITYPTGGFTLFDYEPIFLNIPKYRHKATSIYNNNGLTSHNSNINSVYSSSMSIGEDILSQVGSESGEPSVFEDQEISVKLNIRLQQRFTNTSGRDYIYVSLWNENGLIDGSEQRWYLPSVDPEGDNRTEFDEEFTFNILKNNNYLINVGFGDDNYGHINGSNNEHFTTVPIEVSAGVTYVSGLKEDEGVGIRVKRVSDYTSTEDTSPKIKRFYYNNLKNHFLNKKDITPIEPNYYTLFNSRRLCLRPGQTFPTIQYNLYLTLNSTPTFVTFFKDGSYRQSPFVTTSLGGDNFEDGAIEKEFLIKFDKEAESYDEACGGNTNCALANTSLNHNKVRITSSSSFNGLVENISHWVNKEGRLYKIKNVSTRYNIEEDTIQSNVYVLKNGKDPDNNNYLFALYKDIQIKNLDESSISVDYVEPIPITKYFPYTSEYPNGWPFEDDDNDGVLNYKDREFVPPTLGVEEPLINEMEASFDRIIKEAKTKYHEQIAGTVKESKVIYDETDSLTLKFKYPIDLPSYPLANELKEKHIVNQPLLFEKKRNDILIEKNRIVYGDNLYPKDFYKSKGNSQEQKIMSYNLYDDRGNLLLYTLENGTPVNVIWGYRKQYPIIKIEGEIKSKSVYDIIEQIVAASNDEFTEALEIALINSIKDLRNLPEMKNIMITSYTYDPFIGVTSITPPNGQTVYYEYDEFGRLKSVKDEAGNTVKDIQYHYKAIPE